MAEETPRALEKTQALERQVADLRAEIERIRAGTRGVRPVLFLVLVITLIVGFFGYEHWQDKRAGAGKKSDEVAQRNRADLQALRTDVEDWKKSTYEEFKTLTKSMLERSREELKAITDSAPVRPTAEGAEFGEQIAGIEETARKAERMANAVGKIVDEAKQSVNLVSRRFIDFDARLDEMATAVAGTNERIDGVTDTTSSAAEDANLATQAILDLVRRLDEAQRRIEELEKKVGAKDRPLRSERGGLTLW